MAKVAEYEGTASIKENGETVEIRFEFMQGEFRTSFSATMGHKALVKILRGAKIETKIIEEAVQTRKPKKNDTNS